MQAASGISDALVTRPGGWRRLDLKWALIGVSVGGRIVYSSEKNIFVAPNERNFGMVFQSYAIWPQARGLGVDRQHAGGVGPHVVGF